MAVDQWEEVVADEKKGIWKPQIGAMIEGEVLRIEAGKYGSEVILMTAEQKEMKLPAHKQLQTRLEKVKVGEYIRVTYTGEQANNKGKATKIYTVQVNRAYVRQAKISETPKEEFPQPSETMGQKTSRFLAGVGSAGLHDSRIIDKLTEVFGSVDQANFMFGMLKQTGQIIQRPDGCWVRV